MNLCSDGHDEVCYEGRDCPACVAIDEREDIEKDLADTEQVVLKHEETIERLEGEVADLTAQIPKE